MNPGISGEVRIGGRVVYTPFAKQLAYHNSTAPYPLYGGSKGCGKSKALRWDHYLPSLIVPGMKSLILRRKLKELERSHIRFVVPEAEQMSADGKKVKWVPSDVGAGVLYFPNGSLIEFGHCQHEPDVDQYLSAEYDRISFDEIVTFTEFQYLSITSCCRTTIPGLAPRVGGATNPGGSAAAWVKRRWIDKDVTEDEDPDYDPDDYHYVPALPTDNPHLNWAQYMKMLNRLPPELRRAYRDGDWDIFLGQFFPEFRKADRPDKDGRMLPAHVEEFPPAPKDWPRYGGLDWGYQSPGVYLWAVHHPDGFLDVEDEFVFNGPRNDKLIAREVAQEIVRRNTARGITVKRTFADPSMGESRGHESAETYLDTFRKHGVPCEPADNDRINGWARVRAWLRSRPDGRPFLRVHPRCRYLIRTMGEMLMDEQRPEDMDTDGEDHACLTGDTIIETRDGPKRIDRLGLTDRVWTRAGWQPVEAVALTEADAPLVRITLSNGRTLTGTRNHPVWTENRGFVHMDRLRYSDILCAWQPGARSVTIIERLVRSGARRTAPFRAAITSTIAMAIRATTHSTIWSACARTITSLSTASASSGPPNTWPPFDPLLLHGTGLTMAGNGITHIARPFGASASHSGSVAIAATSSTTTSRVAVNPDSVRTTVGRGLATILVWITSRARARSAASPSSSIDTCAASAAPAPAVRVIACSPAGTGKVYNLTVHHQHEYFANGILVSNCDTLRYIICGRPQAPGGPVETAFPPGSIGALKRQLVGMDAMRRVLGSGNVRKRAWAY